MLQYLLIFLLFVSNKPLLGKLQDHFTKIKGKSKTNIIRNIDFIYMINLDERPEKFKKSMDALAPYDIIPHRFSAINGWKLESSILNEIGVKYNSNMQKGFTGITYRNRDGKEVAIKEDIKEIGTTYFSTLISKGAIGCALSHLSILQDAYDSGYQTIWIMEDDIEVLSNPKEIPNLIQKLDKLAPEWDILFTDRNYRNIHGQYVQVRKVYPRPDYTVPNAESFNKAWYLSNDFTQIKARWCTHSFIIRRSGIKKILDFYKKYKIFHPIDYGMFYPSGMKVFVCNKDIIAARLHALSDNKSPRYVHNKSN